MNNKKILALVLAFAMIFSSMSTVFADTTATIGAEAAALKSMGVLQGDDAGVTPAYLAKVTTRMQAAIMYLRLKGLEDEAMAFTGTTNFADANTMTWNQGKAMMAYLKANPQLGWVGGDGGKFEPFATISVNQYYKVMLEALGYKQTTADVVGDFTWTEVMSFAASKGLVKVAGVTNFTNNDVAIATIEALKTNVNGAANTLATSMVDAGMINKAAAIAAGLYEENTTAVEIKAVKAVANDKVEVEFTAEVAKAFAEKVANYAIVVKGSTTALEIKAAVAESATKVVVETAAQTAGTAYTMTVGGKSINFAGVAKQTAAPEVDGSVKSIDTNTVEVKYTKVMDAVSSTNPANYTLNNGATVKSVKLDSTRKIATLTTEGVANNKIYTLTIKDVKSSDMVAIKTVSKNFAGRTDIKAPTISKFEIKNNQRIKVTFADEHGVDKASVENKANWSITTGSESLEILSIKALDENDDDYFEAVEVATAPQETSKTYKVTISNLKDGSVAGNVISSPLTKDFRGIAADKTAPVIASVVSKTDSMIEIDITDTNRLDYATVTDINNYTFDKDITVLSAEVLDASKPDEAAGKKIILRTSEMELNKAYKLTIANIADEFGNVTNTAARTVTGKAEDVTPPYVTEVKWESSTSVKLVFDDRIDKVTAQDPTNYVIDGGLGAAVKASLSTTDFRTVTLTTAAQTSNKSYKITINNLKDANGNALSNAKAYFTAAVTGTDTTRPTVVTIDPLYSNEIRVTYSEKVNAAAGSKMVVSYGSNYADLVWVGSKVLNGETTMVFKTGNVKAVGDAVDQLTAFTGAAFTMVDNTEYTIEAIYGVTDKANNAYVVDSSDKNTFYGLSLTNDKPQISTIEQLNSKKFRVVFTEPILSPGGTITAANGASFDVSAVDPAAAKNDEGYSTIDLTIRPAGSNIVNNTEYKFNFSALAGLTDYAGTSVSDLNDTDAVSTYTTDITAYVEDKDAPMIDYVEAVSTNKIKVVYNEDVQDSSPTYRIVDADGKTVGSTLTGKLNADADNVIDVTLGSALNVDAVYSIKPVTGAKDIAGNAASVVDVEFSFVPSPVVENQYIKGVELIDAKTIKVRLNADVAAGNTVTVKETDKNGTPVAGAVEMAVSGTAGVAANNFTVALNKALKVDTYYTITVGSGGDLTASKSYTFKGIATEGGIAITNDKITFSGYNATDYVVYVVYNGTSTLVAPADPTGDFVADAAFFTAAGISGGDKYTIEVYRTTRAHSITAGAWSSAYDEYNATTNTDGFIKDSAVLYSVELTR